MIALTLSIPQIGGGDDSQWASTQYVSRETHDLTLPHPRLLSHASLDTTAAPTHSLPAQGGVKDQKV